MTKCVSKTKLDEKLSECEVLKEVGYTPFVVATFRAMYEASPATKKGKDFQLDENNMESILEYATILREDINKRSAKNAAAIKDAHTNAAIAYKNLLDSYKGETYQSWNNDKTSFTPSAIIKQRVSWMAQEFSNIAQELADEHNAKNPNNQKTKFDIIQGFKTKAGRPIAGEEAVFKKLYQKVFDKFIKAEEGSIEQKEYGKILQNWGALCMLSRSIIRRNEGIKLGAYNDYGIRVEDDTVDAVIDGFDLLDIEASNKESWMERKDRISGFTSLGKEVRAVLSSIPKIAYSYDPLQKQPYVYEVKDDLGHVVMIEPLMAHDMLTDLFRGMPSVDSMMRSLEYAMELPEGINVPVAVIAKARMAEAIYNRLKNDPILQTKFFVNYKKGFTSYTEISLKDGKFRTISLNKTYSTGESQYAARVIQGVDLAQEKRNGEHSIWRKSIFSTAPEGGNIYIARDGEWEINPDAKDTNKLINNVLQGVGYTAEMKDQNWSTVVRTLKKDLLKDVKVTSKKRSETEEQWKERHTKEIEVREQAFAKISDMAALFGIEVDSYTLGIMQSRGTLDKFISSVLYLCDPELRVNTKSKKGILAPQQTPDGKYLDFYQVYNTDSRIANDFKKKIRNVYKYIDDAQSDSNQRRARIMDKHGKTTTVFSDQLPCFLTDTFDTIKNFANTNNQEGFEEYVAKKYFESSYFYEGGLQYGEKVDPKKIKNTWLRQMYENFPETTRMFDHHRFAQMDINGKKLSFENLSEKHHTLALLQQFNFSGSTVEDRDYSYYPVFILGDSGVARFVKAPRYSKEDIIEHYYTVFEQEKQLYKQLKQVDKHLKEGTNPSGRKHAGGFKPAQSFNYQTLSFLGTPAEIEQLMQQGPKEVKEAIKTALKVKKDNFKKKLQQEGLLKVTPTGEGKPGIYKALGTLSHFNGKVDTQNGIQITEENIDDYLEQFIYNYSFAMTQQMQMMTVSPNFYKHTEELQKRYKEIHASGTPLDVNAKLPNGERVFTRVNPKTGKKEFYPYETAVYFDDMLINSEVNHPDFIKLVEKKSKGAYSSYLKNTLTDGQSYRSIDSYRKIAIAQGLWDLNGNEEKLYQKLQYHRQTGKKLTPKDLKDISQLAVVLQPQKPYLYTFENFRYKDNSNNTEDTVKIPVQHKCAEVILIPELLPQNSSLRHLAEAMNKNQIDVVCSTEVVKVGEFGATAIDYKTNEDGLYINSIGEVLHGKEGGDTPLNRADQRKHSNFNKVVDGIENPSKYQPVSFLSNETMSPVDVFSAALSKGYKHELSLETYYRQQNVPEHIHDSRNMGTQLRKVFLDGLNAAGNYAGYLGKRLVTDAKGKTHWIQPTEVNIGGKMYDVSDKGGNGGRNIARFYNSLIVANLMRSFDALLHEIGDNQKLSQALQQMIINSSESTYYSLMNFALTGNDDFLTPLYESCNEYEASSKIISLFKKKVQQQKMLGGSAVQASAFGIEDVVKDSHMPNDGGLGYEYEYDSEGNVTNIKWMECEIPFDFSYTDALGNQVQLDYDTYVYNAEDEAKGLGKEGTPKMSEDGKTTLIEKDFPGILNMIAYRIPTERAYSVMNLKIKRFSRKENGGIIRVPAEGTTIAGFDFDIDKLYFLRKEFVARKTTDVENARLWGKAYKKNPHIKQELLNAEALLTTPGSTKILPKISGFIETIFGEDVEEKTRIEAKDNLYEYWEQARLTERTGLTASQFFSRYAKFDAPKVFEEYDYTKDATENSTVQCNNEILNLMWNRMADPETLEARITPGGFPNASKAAKTNRILTTPEYVKKVATETNGEINLDTTQLSSMVDDKNNDYKVAYDVTDPLTLIYYNQQNQIAGTLIGVFANHNSNHMFTSLAEQMTISHTFKLCGHSFNDLIKAPEGRNPSLTIAEFLASSVDAVKDPVLNYLNLNKNTANAGALLARLGYTAEEIGLLFNQPIIKQICERVANDIYLDINTATQEVIKEWNLAGQDISKVDLTKETMMSAIAGHTLATSDGKQTSEDWIKQNKESQAIALQIFNMVNSYASELSDFVATTKYSASGSMGSTWGSLFNLKYATEKYMRDAEKKKNNPKTPHLNIIAYKDKNADHLGIESIKYDPKKKQEYMDYVMSNPFAFEQCEYDMLISFMDNLCGDNPDRKGLFPYSTLMYRTIRDTMNGMTRSEVLSADTIDKIHEDILVALLSSMKDSDFDGNKKIPVGDKTMTQKEYYTKHFADVMLDLFTGKESDINPNTIAALKDWLYIQYDTQNDRRLIHTKRLSSSMKSSKEDFTILWESLATSEVKAEQDLAVSLFLYCFHNFGYEFTSNNFIHNAPEAVKNLTQVISYSTQTEQMGVHTYSDFLNDIMNPDSFYLGHMKSSGKTDVSTATMVRNFIKMYIQNHTEEYSLVYTPKRDNEVKGLENAVKKLEKDSKFVYIELNKNAEKEPWYHKLVVYNSEEQGTKVIPAFVLKGKLYECVNLNEDPESLKYNESQGQASIVIYREVPILGEEKKAKSYSDTMTHEEIESIKLYAQMEQEIAKRRIEEAKANFDPNQVNHDRTYMNENREQQPHC